MADPGYIDDDGVLTDAEAWIALASTTVTSATYNITFTSPNDGSSLDWSQFMDLILITYAQCDHTSYGNNQMRIRLNNVSTNGMYAWQGLRGDGTTVTASSNTYGYMMTTRIPGSKTSPVDQTKMFGGAIHQFFDINSSKAKTVLVTGASDTSGTAGNIEMNTFTFYGGTDRNALSQPPITEIDIEQSNALDYSVGSRFDLFGILPSMLSAGTTA